MPRQAGAMLAKLHAESDHRRANGELYRIVHVSVNPPPKEWAKVRRLRSYRKLRARAYRVARRAGIRAGSVVFHRTRCADKWDPVETDGPHWHVLGFGVVVGCAACSAEKAHRELEECLDCPGFVPVPGVTHGRDALLEHDRSCFRSTGWVVRNHGLKWNLRADRLDERAVRGEAAYLL